MLTRDDRPDDGFTLVELLLSISILGIVMAGLTSAMLISLKGNQQTDARLSEARDLQGAALYFADDVASAAPAGIVVSGSARCGTDPLLVELRGRSFDGALADTITITTYVLRTETVSGVPSRVLHRLSCSTSASSPGYPLTPAQDTTVARLISTSVAPVLRCTTRVEALAASPVAVDCSDPSAVTLRMTLTSRSGDVTPTLIGNRRTS